MRNIESAYVRRGERVLESVQVCAEERRVQNLEFLLCTYFMGGSKNNFFIAKKTVVETISVAISDNSDALCFDLYLINIFEKSTETERCTDVMFKLKL